MDTVRLKDRRALVARMSRVAKRFREAHPLTVVPWDAGSYPIATNYAGRPETKILVWFPTPGCVWSNSGGCTMCDFGTSPNTTSLEHAVQAFEAHLAKLDPGSRRLQLGPGGSFFDDREVPVALRRLILRSLTQLPFLRSVGVETRPTVMTYQKLIDTIDHLPSGVQDLSIGFGFECFNTFVRQVTVNKGYGASHVVRAIDIINKVNSTQDRIRVGFEVYVLLKPIFLTEQEGIDEAVRTIEWSFAQGAESVVLFMNTVKQNTVQGYLASASHLDPSIRYRPPYYRSAVQVLRQLAPWQRKQMQVLGTQSGVLAQGMPRGCGLCTPFLLGALTAHNFTRDPAILDHAAVSHCPCKDGWVAELEAPAIDLYRRVESGIAALEYSFGS